MFWSVSTINCDFSNVSYTLHLNFASWSNIHLKFYLINIFLFQSILEARNLIAQFKNLFFETLILFFKHLFFYTFIISKDNLKDRDALNS